MKKLFYPILIAFITISASLFSQNPVAPALGDGTAGNPYQISTLDNLAWLSVTSSEWVAGKYFIQTTDIDASATSTWNNGEGFHPIGFNPIAWWAGGFYGTYNGNSHTISSLFFGGSHYIQGLFGYNSGTIQNLGLLNVELLSTLNGDGTSGGLVGQCYNSTITNCYTTGNISKDWICGGLVGGAHNTTITNCYSTCNFSQMWHYYSGCLVGYTSECTITNSYSTGAGINLDWGDQVGGLVGWNINTNSTFTDCYYDIETTGLPDNGCGEPKSTEEMKTQSTFVNWDFATVWSISPTYNDGYPNLDGVNAPLPPPIPLSDWAIYIAIMLIGIAIFYRFKTRIA